MNLRVENLTFAYRPGAPVLRELNLEITPAKVTGLFGPNGSGKSTLLRCLTGALRPQSGTVWCGEQRVDTLTPREVARRIAVVPQDTPRGVPLTAREMVALGRFALGDENPAVIAASLAQVDAAELADRPFDELSGGERQRVVIARALAQETPALFLDEPSCHLDIAHQLAVWRLVRTLSTGGHTVLMVCHDLVLAPMFVDRAILIAQGRLVAAGRPVETLGEENVSAVFGCRLRIEHRQPHSVSVTMDSVRQSP